MDERLRQRKRRALDLSALLGKRLKAIRKANNLKQQDVADAMDFARSNVSKIEDGQRYLAAIELPDYAAALGVEPDILFSEVASIVAEYDSSTKAE